MTIIGAIAFLMMSSGSRVFSREAKSVGYLSDLAGAQTTFLDEVMMAGFSPDGRATAQTAFTAVSTGTTADRVQFIADIDSDGVSDRVTYEVTGSDLRRTVETWDGSAWGAPVTQALLQTVRNFDVTFYDANRAAISDSTVESQGTAAARYVHLYLVVGTASSLPIDRQVVKSLIGQVALRN